MNISYDNNEGFAIEGITESTTLSKLFFSKKNIELIHQKIITTIKNKYNYTISKQSDNELLIIMRTIYLNNAKNTFTNVAELKKELKTLNSYVIDCCVNTIKNNIKTHINYVNTLDKDTHLPTNWQNKSSLPEQTSIKGHNSLELKHFF